MGKAHKRPRAGQGRPAGGTKPKGGRQAHSNGAGPQQQEGAGPGSGSDSEPIDILDEDIDFVKENPSYASMLARMDTENMRLKQEVKTERRRKREEAAIKRAAEAEAADEDGEGSASESDEEIAPKKASWREAAVQERASAKTRAPEPEPESEAESEPESESGDVEQSEEVEPPGKRRRAAAGAVSGAAKEQQRAVAQGRRKMLKVDIATHAQAVLQDPARSIRGAKGTKSPVAKLLNLVEDEDPMVCKLAMLSLATVFVDVLPDYRIRPPTELELGMSVSKEQKRLRNFEMGMLSAYQRFLQQLERHAKACDSEDPVSVSLAQTSVKCMCQLLRKAAYFNFRSNLIQAIVQRMGAKEDFARRLACGAISTLFAEDRPSEASMEAAQKIHDLVKARHGRVDPEALETFVALPLQTVLKDNTTLQTRESKKVRRSKSSKRRKVMPDGAEDTVEEELKESQGKLDPVVQRAFQADTLRLVFLTYFRILKQASKSPTVPAVMEGLARFGHLINADVVQDLLELLRDLSTRDVLPLAAGLRCVQAAVAIMTGPGRELHADDKDFVTYLYKLLARIAAPERRAEVVAHGSTYTLQAVSCIQRLFLRRREFAEERVAALVKRLATTALALPPNCALAVMSCIRSLVQRYPKAAQLLESEQERVMAGVFRGDVDDPEHSNAFSATAWEVGLLRFHYHPFVADFAAKTKPGALVSPAQAPESLHAAFDTSDGGFNPALQPPKPHPLRRKALKVEATLQSGEARLRWDHLPRLRPPRGFATAAFGHPEGVGARAATVARGDDDDEAALLAGMRRAYAAECALAKERRVTNELRVVRKLADLAKRRIRSRQRA